MILSRLTSGRSRVWDLREAKLPLYIVEPLSRHLNVRVDKVVQRTGGVAISQFQIPPDGELDAIRRLRAEIEIAAFLVLPCFGRIDGEPPHAGQVELCPAVIAIDPTRGTVFGDREADLELGWNTLRPGQGDEESVKVGAVAIARHARPEGVAVPPARTHLLVLHVIDHI